MPLRKSSFRRDAETSTRDAVTPRFHAFLRVPIIGGSVRLNPKYDTMHLKILISSLAFASIALAQNLPNSTGKRPFTFEDMMALKRLSEPVPSPNGKWVVFAMQDVDLEANTKKSHLWIVPASGGEARRLNPTENEEERPRFSPMGHG